MGKKIDLLYAARHALSNIDYLTNQNRRAVDIVNAIRVELGTGSYADLCTYLDEKDGFTEGSKP